MHTERLTEIQNALKESKVDGWLFYDLHFRDPIAYRVLGLPTSGHTSRRWFYYIPANGEPLGLVHKVEKTKLDSLPGKKLSYLSWRELTTSLQDILPKKGRVMMQYSPMAAIPTVSYVDGGTIELLRSFGLEIVSSADLVQSFEATINEEGKESHIRASVKIQKIKNEAFERVEQELKAGRSLTEFELQQWIVKRFQEEELDCMGHYPIVGVNEHPADPHFEPTLANSYKIEKGSTLLIDLWAKEKKPGAIFYDITWCAFVGLEPPEKYDEIFSIVVKARNNALALIKERFAKGQELRGYEVDDVCRATVAEGGYGDFFIHRTGHSIGETVHGNGANMDNLETKDERRLLPNTCFSIEPGIYLTREMAVRTEINVFITSQSDIVVAGAQQEKLLLLNVP